MKSGLWGIFTLGALLCSCGSPLQTRAAVEKGVRKGVASRGINPDSMDVNVAKVEFHGNRADAVVSFAPKGGKISDGLTMKYTLELRDQEWVITGRSPMDIKQHTGTMETAPSMMDQNSGGTSRIPPLPSDRPSALPPGHPAVGGTVK